MTQENKAAMALASRIVAGAVANAGPLDEVKDLVEHQVRNRIRVDDDGNISVVDDNGAPRVSMRPGFPNMTLEELMDELKSSRPTLFHGSSKSESTESNGSHMDPANPFSRSGWNVTKQMELMMSDPAHAKKLQAERQVGSTNPFSKEGWNVTAQMEIMRSNPTRAAHLQAEAAR